MRYSSAFLVIAGLFITALITANIAAVKPILVGPLPMDAGNIIFPISYIVGDVLTEVYGYRAARRVIWLGFLCNLLAVAVFSTAQALPTPEPWDGQAAYERILGFTPIILLASFCGYLVGEFSNSYVLARMKVMTRGRFLWARTIGSTIIGEGLDSLVFVGIATLGGVFDPMITMSLIIGNWVFKSAYEALVTPITYLVVNALKRYEQQDPFDTETDFNPLAVAH